MKLPGSFPQLKGFRFPREIVAYAVWIYHRFALSTADVEGLLADGGVFVSGETVCLWINRFGRHFANCIRKERPRLNDKWHIDEVVITITGRKFWFWRAIDADGDVLDILVQAHRNTKTAKRFFSRLVRQFGLLRIVVTDKRGSYVKPIQNIAPNAEFKSPRQAQRFCRTTIKSMQSSVPAATISPLSPTAMHAPMPLIAMVPISIGLGWSN